MNEFKIGLKNCYGIQSLNHEFDFSIGSNPVKPKAKVYAIYAPNGLMKSSFAKTFDALSKSEAPQEERYNRTYRLQCIVIYLWWNNIGLAQLR